VRHEKDEGNKCTLMGQVNKKITIETAMEKMKQSSTKKTKSLTELWSEEEKKMQIM
jgi:hypothetical protein